MTGLHGIAVLVVLWCLALLMYHTATGPAIALISVAPASAPCPGDHSSNGSGPSAPAPEGRGAGPGDPVCPLAFDFAHVRLWAAHSVVYCRAAPNATAPNASALRCHFNAHAHNGQADAFCRGTRLVLLPAERALEAACAPVPDAAVPVPLDEFPVFMYDTGLGAIVDDLRMGRARACATSIAGRTYLPLREPGANLFHSFATLFAFFITWTALGSRRDCTIVMLDDHEEGPYWALWSAFCARGVRRLAGLRAEAVCLEEAVLPLAGASAPFWAADRGPIDCPASGLVEAFGRFVRDFHSAAARAPTASTDTGLLRRFSRIPRLTFVVRRGRRELVNGTGWLEDWAAQRSVSLRAVEPHLWPFREQVCAGAFLWE